MGDVVREPKPDPVLGVGEVDRDSSRLLDFGGDSCEGGEAVRGGLGVEEPDVSDLTLPTLMSDGEASSLAPSIISSADLVSSGEVLAEDPNCDKISHPTSCARPPAYFRVPTKQYLSTSSWYNCEDSDGLPDSRAAGLDD
jgi:hypothetical protein